MSGEELVAQRYERFRSLGTFDSLGAAEREEAVTVATGASKPRWARGTGDKDCSCVC